MSTHTPVSMEVTDAEDLPPDNDFVIHDACWRLLLDCFPGYNQPDFSDVLALHVALFACFTPAHGRSTFVAAHDHGGFSKLRSDRRYRRLYPEPERVHLELEERLEANLQYMFSHPFGTRGGAIPSTKSAENIPPPGSTSISILSGALAFSKDPFHALPLEIIYATVTMLPSTELCSPRIASRAAATLCHPSRLPQTFFASRFAPDREIGFTFAGTTKPDSRDTDWRVLYMDLRRSLRDNTNPEVMSKKRIWSCVQVVHADSAKRDRSALHWAKHEPYATASRHGASARCYRLRLAILSEVSPK